MGLPRELKDKESTYQCRRCKRHSLAGVGGREGRDKKKKQKKKNKEETQVQSQVGKIPWKNKGQPTLIFLPEKCYGQRSWTQLRGSTTAIT